MSKNDTRMYWVHAISPLHVGSGKGLGFIDMPIVREKVTGWPVIPGSAVKGVMRDHFTYRRKTDQKLIDAAFGPERIASDTDSNAGSLVLTDARIVCMPVRSLYGTFAYVTCPLVLERLKRDLVAAGYHGFPEKTTMPVRNEAYCWKEPVIASEETIFLEELDFTVNKTDVTSIRWAENLAEILFSGNDDEQKLFRQRFALISDDCFTFLSENGTEIAAHIKIDDTQKIVSNQMLWYEEALPAESILAGIAWCDRVNLPQKPGQNGYIDQKKLFDTFCKGSLDLQMGGKATVGKGRVRCFFPDGGDHV